MAQPPEGGEKSGAMIKQDQWECLAIDPFQVVFIHQFRMTPSIYQDRIYSEANHNERAAGLSPQMDPNGGEKQGNIPPTCPVTFRFRNHGNLPRDTCMQISMSILI